MSRPYSKFKAYPYWTPSGEIAWLYPGERVIDNTREVEMMREANIYIDGVFVGSANGEAFDLIMKASRSLLFSTEISFRAGPHDVRISTMGNAPEVTRKVISILDGSKKPSLADAARAFEQAINAEPGVHVSVVATGADDLAALIPKTRWAVRVTRNERKQVYP